MRRIAWSTGAFTAFEAISEETRERVLLKRWDASEPPVSLEHDPIWREQFALGQLGASAYTYPLRHHPDGSGSWAVIPWFAGTPLGGHGFGPGQSPGRALRVIESVAILLDYLHAVGGVHSSLNPDSILWCEATQTARFSDLGFVQLPALPMLGRAGLLERDRALYLSPEGTGRLGAVIDYRGDFYSLGAILYQVLLAKPPFDYRDPLQLAHAHLARQPVPPSHVDPTLPPTVSDIVLKLLEKTPDARYRSGAGLAADLARCRQQLGRGGGSARFSLAQDDVPTRLRLSTKLYGRSAAQDQILDMYRRLKLAGRGLVMVSGHAGVGKTSLVESIGQTILADGGFFAIGKFQQSTTAQPFLGIVKAVAHLAQHLLAFPEDRLTRWRERLAESLGRNVGLLSALVPEMALVVRPSAPMAELSVDEAKAQFLVTMKRFVRLFAGKGSPLVLFLDDVQWMDDASKMLLDGLLSDPELKHFLVITAYRPNEVAIGSALDAMLGGPPDVPTVDITLKPLTPNAVAHFLVDSFACTEASATELARLLKVKTDGNPFFLRRYVTALTESGQIHYSVDQRRWRWDLDAIRQLQVSENLLDFMLDRLTVYQPEARELLNHLACLGGGASPDDLSVISGLSTQESSRLLMQPMTDGLIVRASAAPGSVGDVYRFTHDKIEQAAYSLVEPVRRRRRHAEIAQRLHEHRREHDIGVFALVEQLDKAGDDCAERFRPEHLAALYLEAAKRSRDNTAYSAARHYLERAASFIAACPEAAAAELLCVLYRVQAEVEYQLGDLGASRSCVDMALRWCLDPSDQAALYTLLIVQDTLQGRYREALDRGWQALSLLGFDLARTDIAGALDREIERLSSIDIAAQYDELLARPEIADPLVCRILDILMYLIPPSYFAHAELNNLIASVMARLAIEHGVSPAATKGLSNFGAVIAERGRYRDGYLFGRLALQLAEKHGYVKARPRVLYTLAGSLNHWVNHLRTTHDIVDDGFAQCLEQGERDYGGYLLTLARCQNEFFLGRPIAAFKREVADIREHVESTQNTLGQGLAAAAYLALSHLDGSTSDDSPFDIGALREADLLASVETHAHGLLACYFHVLKAHNYCFLGKFRCAAESIAAARQHCDSLSTEMTLPMLTLFAALSTLGCLASEDVSAEERAARLAELRDHQTRLGVWRDCCPENFLHADLLVRAGREALDGRTLDAVGTYEEAIRAARDHHYVQFEGLAQFLLADLWRRRGHPDYAEVHLARARACYETWGAKRLVGYIDSVSLRGEETTKPANGLAPDTEIDLINERLDLRALFELTQRLSGEIDLEGLKTEIANAIVAVTGAQKVVVFLAENGAYDPVVTLDIEGRAQAPAESAYPAALVNLVGRTQEASVVRDGIPDLNVAHDPYLRAARPLSALGLPLVQLGTLEGIVYVENRINLMDLSDRKLRYLSVLGAQAAISIRNSLLYSELERKVEERTKALADLADELEVRVKRQVEEIKKLEQLRRFLSPPVADLLLSSGNDEVLKSHRRRIAILFCDLRGYTAFSEAVEPEEAVEMLKTYHRTLGEIVRRHQATVDHLAGDGIMVFVGDPIVSEQPIVQAIDMAVEMRGAIERFIARFDGMGTELGFGIGVSYGYATIGLIGDDERTEYAATGRHVNLASRLCDQATNGQILTTQRVVNQLAGRRSVEYVDEIRFKGFAAPIPVFNVIG